MPFEIIKSDTHIDFIGKRKLAAAVSLALLLASVVAVFARGVRVGIDFAGGTEIQVRFSEPTDEGAVRSALGNVPGLDGLLVVRYGEASNEFLIKFQARELEAAEDVVAEAGEDAPSQADLVEQISGVLAGAIGPHSFERVEFVGPRVGAELRDDGLKALLYASIVIMIYIAFRFTSRFAPGAVVAVIHDLAITAGIFVILGLEFDLRILAAMLAILGYSLNDTIIIYDRIRENLELRTKADLPEVLNQSVNQTLSRTVLTSSTTLLALISLLALGGDVIRPFAFAMTVGIVVGTYSSIFIAAPTLLFLEQRFGQAKA